MYLYLYLVACCVASIVNLLLSIPIVPPHIIRSIDSHIMSFFQSSSVSYSTSTVNGQTTGQAYKQETTSNSQGTSVRNTSQRLGEPAIADTRHYDTSGREITGGSTSSGSANRIQDVTDETEADRRYREAIEDEYAKREGGA